MKANKYITKIRDDYYKVRIQLKGAYKTFKTLKEAREYRDEVLDEKPPEITQIDSPVGLLPQNEKFIIIISKDINVLKYILEDQTDEF